MTARLPTVPEILAAKHGSAVVRIIDGVMYENPPIDNSCYLSRMEKRRRAATWRNASPSTVCWKLRTAARCGRIFGGRVDIVNGVVVQ